MGTPIQFFSEEISFKLDKEDSIRNWILSVILGYEKKAAAINYIFCSDNYLLELNKSHLSHDYYTDILTFPYTVAGSSELLADIYISVDRVRDNAKDLGHSFDEELHRVMIHGVLHLIGFDDHGDQAQHAMRKEEDIALSKRSFIK